MTDLPDFLAARINEDREAVREFAGTHWSGEYNEIEDDTGESVLDMSYTGGCIAGFLEHATRWDPARVRLECDAKTGILLHYMTQRRRAEALNRAHADNPAIFYPEPWDLSLRYLALPYRDHPDWQESWLPPEPGTVETWGRR